jgi:hypothetical protein
MLRVVWSLWRFHQRAKEWKRVQKEIDRIKVPEVTLWSDDSFSSWSSGAESKSSSEGSDDCEDVHTHGHVGDGLLRGGSSFRSSSASKISSSGGSISNSSGSYGDIEAGLLRNGSQSDESSSEGECSDSDTSSSSSSDSDSDVEKVGEREGGKGERKEILRNIHLHQSATDDGSENEGSDYSSVSEDE